MADWPTTLPQEFIVDGFSYKPPKGAIRTNMDKGPAKQRLRTTSNVQEIRGTVVMTSNQYNNDFLPFYNNNLSFGVLSFNWTHPLYGNNCSMRIVDTDMSPNIDDFISLKLDVEILP